MALIKYHGCKKYNIIFRDLDGKVKSRTTGTENKKEALIKERIFMLDLKMERKRRKKNAARAIPSMEYVSPGSHKHGSMSLSDMWDCATSKRAFSDSYKKAWNRFIREIGVKYADQVTPQMAQKYLEERYISGDQNNKTFNNNRTYLNAIFRYCLVEAHLKDSPFRTVISRKLIEELTDHHRPFTYEEFERIISSPHASILDRFMIMSERWTTQRLETCQRFTLSMYDFDNKVFVIQPSKTKRFFKFVCVPIFPEYEAFIRSEIVPLVSDPDVPITKFLKWKSRDAFSMHFSRLLKKIDILDDDTGTATFHSGRGTGITWLKEQGISYEDRTNITGHASKNVEDIYARAIKRISKVAKGFY